MGPLGCFSERKSFVLFGTQMWNWCYFMCSTRKPSPGHSSLGQGSFSEPLPSQNPGGGVFIIIIFFLIWYFCSPCSPARRCSVFQKEVLFWFTRRQRDSFFSWQNTWRPLHKSTTHCLAWHLWLFQAWFQLTFALFPRYLLGKTLHLDTVDHFSMPVHALFFLSLPLIDVPV